MAMSDAAGSNFASCCNSPSQDDRRLHDYQPEQSAAKLPEYSQQPIDGIDTHAEVTVISLPEAPFHIGN